MPELGREGWRAARPGCFLAPGRRRLGGRARASIGRRGVTACGAYADHRKAPVPGDVAFLSPGLGPAPDGREGGPAAPAFAR